MSSTAPKDFSTIAQDAVDVGSVAPEAQDAVSRAVQSADGVDTGIDAKNLDASRVFLVYVEIDDSGSMKGTEIQVRRAMAKLKEELLLALDESEEVIEVLISISFLNRGLLQSYCRVEDCVDLDDSNHECDGGTPLFSKANEGLGAMMTKVAELKAAGRTAQSFSVFISDGEASDEDVMLGGEHVSPLANASRLISGMTTMKQHIVCGVSIGGGADATFRSMGIANKWILSPENDEFAFNDAMRQVSRASRAASRGAGAFQTTADGGFR